ncbi:hypothetical protein GCM10027048_05970 [Hymenobacter coalescens]
MDCGHPRCLRTLGVSHVVSQLLVLCQAGADIRLRNADPLLRRCLALLKLNQLFHAAEPVPAPVWPPWRGRIVSGGPEVGPGLRTFALRLPLGSTPRVRLTRPCALARLLRAAASRRSARLFFCPAPPVHDAASLLPRAVSSQPPKTKFSPA